MRRMFSASNGLQNLGGFWGFEDNRGVCDNGSPQDTPTLYPEYAAWLSSRGAGGGFGGGDPVFGSGDRVGIAVDMDAREVAFYVNGESSKPLLRCLSLRFSNQQGS